MISRRGSGKDGWAHAFSSALRRRTAFDGRYDCNASRLRIVSTCLLSLAEPICGDGRCLKVEYSPSPASDGLQLAVTDLTPPLPPFNFGVTSKSRGAMKFLGRRGRFRKLALAGSSSL